MTKLSNLLQKARQIQAADIDKDLSAKQVREYLISNNVKHAYSMKPSGKLDHLKLKLEGIWFEIEPFYKYDTAGYITDMSLKINSLDGTEVPSRRRGQFSLYEWDRYWHGTQFEKAKIVLRYTSSGHKFIYKSSL